MFVSRHEYDTMAEREKMGELSRKKLSKENKRLIEQLEDQQTKHDRETDRRRAEHDDKLEHLTRKAKSLNRNSSMGGTLSLWVS